MEGWVRWGDRQGARGLLHQKEIWLAFPVALRSLIRTRGAKREYHRGAVYALDYADVWRLQNLRARCWCVCARAWRRVVCVCGVGEGGQSQEGDTAVGLVFSKSSGFIKLFYHILGRVYYGLIQGH